VIKLINFIYESPTCKKFYVFTFETSTTAASGKLYVIILSAMTQKIWAHYLHMVMMCWFNMHTRYVSGGGGGWEKCCVSKQFLKPYFGYHIPRIHQDRRKIRVLDPRETPAASSSHVLQWLLRAKGRWRVRVHMFGNWREPDPRHSTKFVSLFGEVITRILLMLPVNAAGPEEKYFAAWNASSLMTSTIM
jgi:hypothetical protein